MERIYRRLVLIGIAIAVTLAVGTLGFTLIERFPLLDAFYMSLITV
ncbi:MAG: potassium channel protein, partial [Acidobacteria bacterium]|nr:potassium channel protein [Acidobacteriota bacterium]